MDYFGGKNLYKSSKFIYWPSYDIMCQLALLEHKELKVPKRLQVFPVHCWFNKFKPLAKKLAKMCLVKVKLAGTVEPLIRTPKGRSQVSVVDTV